MKNLPKLLNDAHLLNEIDIGVITKNLKIPWLKLDFSIAKPTKAQINTLITNQDWRKVWKFKDYSINSYQVKNWNGQMLFGPTDFAKFLEKSNKNKNLTNLDEDTKCKYFRKIFNYDWYVDEHNFIRKEIQKYIPKNDLNIVNTYVLSPGGYVFPHRDYSIDGLGLAKIYIALKWPEGSTFGMYGCGNLPIQEGDVFLINNYTLPHWVVNQSNDHRIVIDIGANLHSPVLKESIIKSFKKTFLLS